MNSFLFFNLKNRSIEAFLYSMKKSKHLHQLIHSMTKTEKRYLKVNNQREGSIYLKVFDTILEQQEYDDRELKDLLNNENIRSPLPRVQHHLYQLILKNLAAFHANQQARYQVMDGIRQYILLRDRGLHAQGQILLKKALTTAQDNNYYGLVLEIADLMEDWVTEEKSYDLALKQKQQLSALIVDNTQYIRSVASLKDQIFELRLFFLEHKFARSEQQRAYLIGFESAPLLALETASNPLIRRLLLTILVYVYYGLQDYEKLIDIEQKRIALFNKNGAAAHVSPFLVYSYHRNLLWIYLSSKQYNKHQQLAQSLSKDKALAILSQSNYYSIKFKLAMSISSMYGDVNRQQYAKAYRHINAIWAVFQAQKAQPDTELLIQSLILFLNTCFCLGKYEECLRWLNYIEQQIPQSYLMPYQNMGKIAHLLIHHGLGHHRLLENMLESTRIRLYRKFNFFYVANTFLKCLRRLTKNKYTDKKEILMKYQHEMKAIAQQEGQQGFFILFNFVDWFEASLKDCYIADLYK